MRLDSYNTQVLSKMQVATAISVMLIWLCCLHSAHAATQIRTPNTCSSVGGAGPSWNSTAQAQTNDGQYAIVTIDGSASEYLQCTNYGFAIPLGATINGITVNIERASDRDSNGGSRDEAVRTVKGGVIGTADRASAAVYTTTDTVQPHGGAADMWGQTWTVADINASNFGAAFRTIKPTSNGPEHDVRVDLIEITVDYTPDTAPPTITGIGSYCGGANQLLLTFSEILNTASAQTTSNYAVSGGVSVTSAVLQSDGRTVLLRTSAMPAGSYTLSVSGVTDLAGNPIVAGTQPVTVNGLLASGGIKGSYYTGTSDQFPGTPIERIDGTINFNWGNGIPIAGVSQDSFSVRWMGYVIPPFTGSYVLRTTTDDGVRLYLDGQLLIDDWNDQAASNNDVAVTLSAGRYYALQMDYYENAGQAVAQLFGNYNNTGFQPVPSANLFYCQSQATVTPGRFDAFDTATAVNATAGFITTKIAASTFNLDLIALNTATPAAIQTNFTGDVKVELLGNIATGITLGSGNCPQTSTVLGTSTATFAAADQGRKNNVQFDTTAYAELANAWRDVRVRISYPATGTATVVSCSGDNFAIRPASLSSVLARDQDWTTAGTARSLNNTSVNGGNVHKAGRPFSISAEARNSANTITSNYNGTPALSAVPCDGSGSGCTVNVGTVSAASWTAASGVVSTGTANYSEVGTFGLRLEDTSFAVVDNSDGSTAAQRNIPLSATVLVGRFVPDYFEVAVASGNTPQFKTFNDATCASRSFTYIGQPFGYVTVPRAVITARNASGVATANYQNAWWKITGTGVQQTYASVSGTVTGVNINAPEVVANNNNTGTGTITVDAGDLVRFNRNTTTPQASFNANIVLTVAASDTSESSGTITTATPAVFNGGGTGIEFDAGNAFHYGILKLSNAHGSELLSLPVPAQVQYWNGSGFVTNTADHCTSIAASAVSMSNFQKNLNACETTTTFGGRFANGKGSLVLSAPGANNTGSVDLRINLASESGNACVPPSSNITATSAAQDYLRGKSAGSYEADPGGRASFGVRKSGPVIYTREIYY